MTIQDSLQSVFDNTIVHFSLDEEELNKSYGHGKWTIREILHHIADTETVLYDRIRRTISNPGQVVWGFDQDAWARALDYNSRSLTNSKNIYKAVRPAIIELASIHYSQNGHLTLIHSGDGKKTLKDLFDKVVWHNEGHLDQINKALSL